MEHAATGAPLTNAQHRTAARLESFGDIVYGFTLVLMASRLRAPEKPEDLVAELPEFILFLVAFGILCVLWYRHHVIFRDVFVPDVLSTVVNFLVLADIAIFPYPLDLYFKFGVRSAIALAAYALVLGCLNVFVAVLNFRGLQLRGSTIEPQVRTRTLRTATRSAILGLVLLACSFAYPFGLQTMGYVMLIGVCCGLGGYGIWRRVRHA
ncbi:MAG TPA: TMEM175 family protein [Candidatus Eremiobacteraceae bacterium]|nr:TMEM175 family protein [Candidatus Eremiobacteraceae bacterium]